MNTPRKLPAYRQCLTLCRQFDPPEPWHTELDSHKYE